MNHSDLTNRIYTLLVCFLLSIQICISLSSCSVSDGIHNHSEYSLVMMISWTIFNILQPPYFSVAECIIDIGIKAVSKFTSMCSTLYIILCLHSICYRALHGICYRALGSYKSNGVLCLVYAFYFDSCFDYCQIIVSSFTPIWNLTRAGLFI